MNLFAFGLGYCALHFIDRFGERFDEISGTVRGGDKAAALTSDGLEAYAFGPEREDPEIAARLSEADVIIVSVPPGTSIDPVLARFGRKIATSRREQTIVYLSTIGVYGDRQGAWVDETSEPTPSSSRSLSRLQAERAWTAIGKERTKRTRILRLAGLYGPGRNALINLKRGAARRIIKEDQVFNRIHVEDVSRAIDAAIAYEGQGSIWNVSDDAPAPPQDVVTYAAMLMGVEPPPEQDFATAEMTPLTRSFYAENKRASNRKLKEELGVELAFPTYRVGLDALWQAGEGRDEAVWSSGGQGEWRADQTM
jgi:dTDP-4-dehydrorhamnose reductase